MVYNWVCCTKHSQKTKYIRIAIFVCMVTLFYILMKVYGETLLITLVTGILGYGSQKKT